METNEININGSMAGSEVKKVTEEIQQLWSVKTEQCLDDYAKHLNKETLVEELGEQASEIADAIKEYGYVVETKLNVPVIGSDGKTDLSFHVSSDRIVAGIDGKTVYEMDRKSGERSAAEFARRILEDYTIGDYDQSSLERALTEAIHDNIERGSNAQDYHLIETGSIKNPTIPFRVESRYACPEAQRVEVLNKINNISHNEIIPQVAQEFGENAAANGAYLSDDVLVKGKFEAYCKLAQKEMNSDTQTLNTFVEENQLLQYRFEQAGRSIIGTPQKIMDDRQFGLIVNQEKDERLAELYMEANGREIEDNSHVVSKFNYLLETDQKDFKEFMDDPEIQSRARTDAESRMVHKLESCIKAGNRALFDAAYKANMRIAEAITKMPEAKDVFVRDVSAYVVCNGQQERKIGQLRIDVPPRQGINARAIIAKEVQQALQRDHKIQERIGVMGALTNVGKILLHKAEELALAQKTSKAFKESYEEVKTQPTKLLVRDIIDSRIAKVADKAAMAVSGIVEKYGLASKKEYRIRQACLAAVKDYQRTIMEGKYAQTRGVITGKDIIQNDLQAFDKAFDDRATVIKATEKLFNDFEKIIQAEKRSLSFNFDVMGYSGKIKLNKDGTIVCKDKANVMTYQYSDKAFYKLLTDPLTVQNKGQLFTVNNRIHTHGSLEDKLDEASKKAQQRMNERAGDNTIKNKNFGGQEI